MNSPYLNSTPVVVFVAFAALVVVLEARLLLCRGWRRLRRQTQRPVRFSDLLVHSLAGLGLLCILYAAFVEPYWPEVTTVRLETDKLNGTTLRIVQISDLHCDAKPRLEERLPEIVNGLKPDVIVFTGDALNSAEAHPLFVQTLAAMEASLGKFAIRGNWDYLFAVTLFEGTGFEELPLEAVRLEKDGEAFMVCGVNYHNGRISQRALNQLDPGTYNILLHHTSVLVDFLDETDYVDLYLCGHTHGGQIALPFHGALTTMSEHGKAFEAGLYRVGPMAVYVNRGIGMGGMGPRMRFFARPEITLFEISPAGEQPHTADGQVKSTAWELFLICGIGIGLAMDAFAVSVVCGAVFRKLHVLHALRMALFFGAFQSVMPLVGFAAGKTFEGFIGVYDHWLAFVLLTAVGSKMVYEAFKIEEVEARPGDPASLIALLVLSVATSIDALAVGVTLSLVTRSIGLAVSLIGVITFVLSYLGYHIGKRFGHFFENKIEIAGGLILVAIGIKILLAHLLA